MRAERAATDPHQPRASAERRAEAGRARDDAGPRLLRGADDQHRRRVDRAPPLHPTAAADQQADRRHRDAARRRASRRRRAALRSRHAQARSGAPGGDRRRRLALAASRGRLPADAAGARRARRSRLAGDSRRQPPGQRDRRDAPSRRPERTTGRERVWTCAAGSSEDCRVGITLGTIAASGGPSRTTGNDLAGVAGTARAGRPARRNGDGGRPSPTTTRRRHEDVGGTRQRGVVRCQGADHRERDRPDEARRTGDGDRHGPARRPARHRAGPRREPRRGRRRGGRSSSPRSCSASTTRSPATSARAGP